MSRTDDSVVCLITLSKFKFLLMFLGKCSLGLFSPSLTPDKLSDNVRGLELDSVVCCLELDLNGKAFGNCFC